MPRVRPRKQPCDCERCTEEPVGEVESVDPALIRSLLICVSDLRQRPVCGDFKLNSLHRLVQQGYSGSVYFAKELGAVSQKFCLAALETSSHTAATEGLMGSTCLQVSSKG